MYRAYMQGDRKMRYFEDDLKGERFVLGKGGQVVQVIPSGEGRPEISGKISCKECGKMVKYNIQKALFLLDWREPH